jgi:hypothetical protein
VLHLQHIAQPDAVRIERDLATALADAGLMVLATIGWQYEKAKRGAATAA